MKLGLVLLVWQKGRVASPGGIGIFLQGLFNLQSRRGSGDTVVFEKIKKFTVKGEIQKVKHCLQRSVGIVNQVLVIHLE